MVELLEAMAEHFETAAVVWWSLLLLLPDVGLDHAMSLSQTQQSPLVKQPHEVLGLKWNQTWEWRCCSLNHTVRQRLHCSYIEGHA